MIFAALLSVALLLVTGGSSLDIELQLDSPLTTVSDKFLSVAIDSGTLGGGASMIKYLNNRKFMALLSQLSPAYLRIGGTMTESIVFSGNRCQGAISWAERKKMAEEYGIGVFGSVTYKNFIPLCGERFAALCEIASRAGVRLLYNLNAMLRNPDGSWKPTNADKLLSFAQEKGYSFDVHLGNEPNAFKFMWKHEVTPKQLAHDQRSFASVLAKYSNFKDALQIGPDVSHVGPDYMEQFVAEDDTVSAFSTHMYYTNGKRATLSDFTNPKTYERFNDLTVAPLRSYMNANGKGNRRVWITESASAVYGGAKNVSDRYADGFLWLEELGMAAKLNVEMVARQAFVGRPESYSLLDYDCNVKPSYWLSVIYKRLVGPTVLDVSLKAADVQLRLYAHCAKESAHGKQNGDVVLFGVNYGDSKARVAFADKSHVVEKYILTAPGGDLSSRFVLLNGKKLEMASETELPSIRPVTDQTLHFELPEKSFGFYVIRGINAPACL